MSHTTDRAVDPFLLSHSDGPAGNPLYPMTVTVAGSGRHGFIDGHVLRDAYFDCPLDLCVMPDKSILIADGKNNCLRRLELATQHVSTINTAAFLGPRSPVVIDNGAAIVVCDSGHHKIRMLKFAEDGSIHDYTIAGTGKQGLYDASGESATFNKPIGLCVIQDGSILVADSGNHCIRRIASRPGRPGLIVSTVAGGSAVGFRDGVGRDALFDSPSTVVIDRHGTILITDTGNGSIRTLHPPPSGNFSEKSWLVTTVAGGPDVGFEDGDSHQAKFREPVRAVVGSSGELLVSDAANHCIRALSANGSLGPQCGLFAIQGGAGLQEAESDSKGGSTLEHQLTRALSGPKHVGVFCCDDKQLSSRRYTVLVPASLLSGAETANNLLMEAIHKQINGTQAHDAFSFEDSITSAGSSIQMVLWDDVERVVAAHLRYSHVSTVAGPCPQVVAELVAKAAAEAPARTSVDAAATLATAAGLASVLKRSKTTALAAAQTKALAAFGRYMDGPSSQARFRRPHGLCVVPDGIGSVLVADSANHFLRLLATPRALEIQPSVLRYVLTPAVIQQGKQVVVASRLRDASKDVTSPAGPAFLNALPSPTSRYSVRPPSPVRSPTASTPGAYVNRSAWASYDAKSGVNQTSHAVAFGATIASQEKAAKPVPAVSHYISTRRGPDIPVKRSPRSSVRKVAAPKVPSSDTTQKLNKTAKSKPEARPTSTPTNKPVYSWLQALAEKGESVSTTPQSRVSTPMRESGRGRSLPPSRPPSSTKKDISPSTASKTSRTIRREMQGSMRSTFDGSNDVDTPLVNGVPKAIKFMEELGASRHRTTYEPIDSRTALAVEEANPSADVVKALLLTDAIHPSSLHQQRVTTASVDLIRARYTQHTAASAAAMRAKGKAAIHGVPAFVNVNAVVSQKLEDLRQRAGAASSPADRPRSASSRRTSTSHPAVSTRRRLSVTETASAIMSESIAHVIRQYHPSFQGADTQMYSSE